MPVLNLFTLPPQVPFLDAVAAEWLAHARAMGGGPLDAARGLILLPTRRAARALAEAFLRVSGGRALLLPRIMALGALDEAPLALAGAFDLPPAIEPMQRLAALSRMILAMGGRDGAPVTADRAWRLAGELAGLMDEAERAEIDLTARLPDAADPEFAAHWARTLDFLRIVTVAWPALLAEQGMMNPVGRQIALLDAQAAAWERKPPDHRVLLAGVTGGSPAACRLAGVVARLPAGSVLLSGLDLGLSEPAWDSLEASHHQAALRSLLHALGATRGDVRLWPVSPANSVPRAGRTCCAARCCRGFRWVIGKAGGAAEIVGISRLDPADQQEEAAATALVLRDALERPGLTAALVTPDRELAGRVAAELGRFGVVADDSAGEPLAETPPAVFLRLLARAVAEELAPVPLLALLKHPMAAAGVSPAACRAGARALELACLRGPRPAPGLSGLRHALDLRRGSHRDSALALLNRVERALAPALRIAASVDVAPAEALDGLIEAAEHLAATDDTPGASRLWAAEEGEALAERLASVRACLGMLPASASVGAAGLAGCGAGGCRGAQPAGAPRARRSRASARVHLGIAGSAAAERRCACAGRAGRGRLARRDRSRPVAVTADAGAGRAGLAGGNGGAGRA